MFGGIFMNNMEERIKERFLKISEKHGNGLLAFEQLEYEVYVDHIDEYEALEEEEKIKLNVFMRAFRSLYK
jgi:hypothetical protein